MNDFKLDPKLNHDCHLICKLKDSQLLLMDNALFTWFILVPETDQEELYRLPSDQRVEIYQQIDHLSQFVDDHFDVYKLNIAAIGNVVSQLHIHIIGRRKSDPCWPGVVWGYGEKESYTEEAVDKIRNLFKAFAVD